MTMTTITIITTAMGTATLIDAVPLRLARRVGNSPQAEMKAVCAPRGN